MKASVVLLALVGCASAGEGGGNGDPDAAIHKDSPNIHIDGPPGVDSPVQDIDAPPHIDAPGCTVMQVELLTNGHFDNAPMGTGWTENSTYGIITDEAGLNPDTSPYRAWLGGDVSYDDSVYQAVAIPATATALTLTGVYAVGTQDSTSTVYDQGVLAFLDAAGSTELEEVMALDNTTVAANWTPFSHTVTNLGAMAGQTVLVYMESANDVSLPTNFWFDSFSLTATNCQ